MIDLSESYDSEILRMGGGLQANNIEEQHRKLELALRIGDEAMVLATARKIVKAANEILDTAAWAITREEG